jgi:hypothetical protein
MEFDGHYYFSSFIDLFLILSQLIPTHTLLKWTKMFILKLVVCILLRVLGQVQGFRLTQHSFEYFSGYLIKYSKQCCLDGNPEPDKMFIFWICLPCVTQALQTKNQKIQQFGIPGGDINTGHVPQGPWSLRWDSKVWLWVLRDSDHWVITLQTADPSSRQRGHPIETRQQPSGRR